MYNSAHNLAILELAPDAIIRQDLELLRSLFIRFDSDGKRDKIEHWFVRGKVLFQKLFSRPEFFFFFAVFSGILFFFYIGATGLC